MVLSRSFRDERGKYYFPGDVVERDGNWYSRDGQHRIETQVEKMSKSRNNGVPPEKVIAEYGADSLRLYEVFMGPMEDSVLWQTDGIVGVRRFLDRAWRLFNNLENPDADGSSTPDPELERLLHQTIRKLTEDIENLKLNTSISQLMIFVNEALKRPSLPVLVADVFVRLLAPFAPHLAEELWQRLGHNESVAFAPWPLFDPAKCMAETVSVVVQVNGKTRARVTLPSGVLQSEAEEAALKNPDVLRHVGNRPVKKTVLVPDRLLNIVV